MPGVCAAVRQFPLALPRSCLGEKSVTDGALPLQVSDFVLENRKPTDAVSEMVDSFR